MNLVNGGHGTKFRPRLDRSCTIGLADECFAHEECIPRNSRSRVGNCECMKGYKEDIDTGWCEPEGSTGITDSEFNATDTNYQLVTVAL